MFNPRFAKLVKAGNKLQKIRPLPKRSPRSGDTLSLRLCVGKPYRSKQRALIETKLDEIKACHMDEKSIVMQPSSGCLLAIAGAKVITLDGEYAEEEEGNHGGGWAGEPQRQNFRQRNDSRLVCAFGDGFFPSRAERRDPPG